MMVGAGGCCRVGQYEILIESLIEKQQLRDVALCSLSNDDGYAGLGLGFRLASSRPCTSPTSWTTSARPSRPWPSTRPRGTEIFDREVQKLLRHLRRSQQDASIYRQLRADRARPCRASSCARPSARRGTWEWSARSSCAATISPSWAFPSCLPSTASSCSTPRSPNGSATPTSCATSGCTQPKTNFVGRIEALVSGSVQDHHENRDEEALRQDRACTSTSSSTSGSTWPIPPTSSPWTSPGAGAVLGVGPAPPGRQVLRRHQRRALRLHELAHDRGGRHRRDDGRRQGAGGRNAGTRCRPRTTSRERIDALPFLFVELDGTSSTQIEEARLETFLLQAQRLAEHMKAARNGNGHHPGPGKRLEAPR